MITNLYYLLLLLKKYNVLLLLLDGLRQNGIPITIYDRPTYYYYHPMCGYIAPLPILC